MAKITRIKASDPGKSPDKAPKKAAKAIEPKAVSTGSVSEKSENKAKNAEKPLKKNENSEKKSKNPSKTEKKPFILIRPFICFGRYIRDSWREIRQVRWPSRKATWKLVLAIFIYTGIFVAIIMLLDALFTWVFGLLIN